MNIKLFDLTRATRKAVYFSVPLMACWAFSAVAYERIVSATGNASEIIAELGFAEKLVAVDTTSMLPVDVMSAKPKIGYRRALSAEGILSMQPDLLILAPDAGPPTVIEQLKATNMPSVTIGDVKTVQGVIDDIEMLAEKLGAQAAAKPMIARIRDDEKRLNGVIADYPRQPSLVFLMDTGMGGSRLMALGDKTAGNAMIQLVGGVNAFADFNSVKPVSAESLASTEMDVIIVAAHGKIASKKHKSFKEGKRNSSIITAKESIANATADYPNLALTKAGKNNCIFRIGILQALGFGPGFSLAANDISSVVKPCLTTEQ